MLLLSRHLASQFIFWNPPVNRQQRRQQKKKVGTGQGLSIKDTLQAAFDCQKVGNHRDAEKLYKKALASDPKNSFALHWFGVLCRQTGKHDDAIRYLEKAVLENPDDPEPHNSLGIALTTVRSFERAISCFEIVARLAPKNIAPFMNLGNALQDAGRYDDAAAAFRSGINIAPNDPDLRLNLAGALRLGNRIEEAIKECTTAIDLRPDFTAAHNLLGILNSVIGHLDEARYNYKKVMEFDPTRTEAFWHLVQLEKLQEGDPVIEKMQTLFDAMTEDNPKRHHLGFALGKAFEDIGEYEKAISYYSIANTQKRSALSYDVQGTVAHFENIKRLFTRDFVEKHIGPTEDRPTPLFVLGMPRSATTLVEQILAAHPQVYGAGELNTLRLSLIQEFGQITDGDVLKGLSNDFDRKCLEASEVYIRKLRDVAPLSAFVTDKMPHNFQLLGFIRCMFPNAKVIHCKRDPVDTCLSIFKMNFSSDHYHYAYDQKETARFYLAYQDLMAHWHEALPGFIHDLDYETLIADQQGTTAALLKFCGLDWDDACMEFHRHKRAINTASFAQVRKPISDDAIRKWKMYRPYIGDMLEVLYSSPERAPVRDNTGI